MSGREVTLSAERYGESAYYLRARTRDDGALVIEGHDLGEAPRKFWGRGEYEWEIVVAPEHLAALIEALGGAPGADLLDLLTVRYGEDERFASRTFLEEQGIAFGFWSRAGD